MSAEPPTKILPAVPEHFGRVLLFTGGDPIAAIVKWQSRSHYSHAALLMPGSNTVIESYPFKGVRKRVLTARDWERIHAFAVPGMTGKQWRECIEFAEKQMGMGYDWRNVFRFVTRIPARENQRWFCSELVFEALAVAYLRVLMMSPGYVNPGHLAASPYLRRDFEFETQMLQFLTDETE